MNFLRVKNGDNDDIIKANMGTSGEDGGLGRHASPP